MLTRRSLLAATAAAGAALGLGSCADDRAWSDASGRVRLATGTRGAVFDQYGRALATVIGDLMPSTSPSTLDTDGSVDNVRQIVAGRAEIGFCLGDTAAQAVAGRAPFAGRTDLVALARLYDSFLQVVVRADSPVRRLADLRGRRVAVGERLSGTLLTASRTLGAAGVGLDELTTSHLGLADALVALAARRLDALCFVSGFPIQPVVEFAQATPVRVLDLGDLVPRLVDRHGAQYVAGPLPASPYGLPGAVQTVSVKTQLVAGPELSDDVAAGVSSVIFDEQARIADLVPDVRQPTAAAGIFTDPLPLHPGALAYFRERDRAGS